MPGKKPKKRAARHSAASKRRFFSAPGLDASREIVVHQQTLDALDTSTHVNAHSRLTANDNTVAD